LNDYLFKKRDIIMLLNSFTAPSSSSISPHIDYKNFLMMCYYRNPINHIFFNEGIIVASIYSFGHEKSWKEGVHIDALYERAVFLSNLLRREEVLKEQLWQAPRAEVFDKLVAQMLERKILARNANDKSGQTVVFKSSNETFIVFAQSLVQPMVDSYFVALLYMMSLIKNKAVEFSQINKRIQWLSESLYEEKAISYFESCNSASFAFAVQQYLEMKILEQKSIYLILASQYRKNEGALQKILD
jgi:glycerol-3-phosphate O-acyltransferase